MNQSEILKQRNQCLETFSLGRSHKHVIALVKKKKKISTMLITKIRMHLIFFKSEYLHINNRLNYKGSIKTHTNQIACPEQQLFPTEQ